MDKIVFSELERLLKVLDIFVAICKDDDDTGYVCPDFGQGNRIYIDSCSKELPEEDRRLFIDFCEERGIKLVYLKKGEE